ncbi:MAG: hypothetical protein PVI97_19445 [Candidatus Thiodiazotropha sp.]|jgi:hypothetical protein
MKNTNNTKDCSRLFEKIKSLNNEKKAYRSKAIFNWKIRKKLEEWLIKTRQERNNANLMLREALHTLQEFQNELQHKIISKEEAWKKASKSNTELEAMKQQFISLNSQFQQKVSDLQNQIQHQAESDVAVKQRETEENKKLQKALNEASNKLNAKDLTIRKLRNQKKVLCKEKIYLKNKIYQQAKMHKVRTAKQKVKLASTSRKIDLLKAEYAKLNSSDSKTKRQANTDKDYIVKQLLETIKTMKTKINKTEKQVSHYNKLKRDRQAQESTIKTLNSDLDKSNKEKTLLKNERNRLVREIRELKGGKLYTPPTHKTPHKKASLSMKMLQL